MARTRECTAPVSACVALRTLLWAALLSTSVVALEKRKAIDWDALEKAWAADDDVRELRSDADEQVERLSQAPESDAKLLGPQMIFVTLKTQESLDTVASRWKQMLWNGGVDVNVYEIDANKVLIGLQKGDYMRDLRLFLKEQTEVVEYEWNSKTFSRADPVPEERRGMNKRSTKKGQKTRSKTKKKKVSTKEHSLKNHRASTDTNHEL